MTMPKVAPTSTTQTAQAETPQKPKRFKGFKNPFASANKSAQAKTTPRPAGSDVFAEAGRSRRSGGAGKAFSSGLRFFTGAHPDKIRNRADNVGAAFAAKVDAFESGKSGGLLGPLFGMGFKNYNRPAGGHAPSPFAAGAGSAQSGPPGGTQTQAPQPASPFAGAQGGTAAYNTATFAEQVRTTGNDFASRLDAFSRHGAGAEGPLGGLGTGRVPTPPASGAATYPAPDVSAFQQQASQLGNDFASRLNAYQDAPNGQANPFAGMGTSQTTASAASGPAASPADPTGSRPAAPAQPAPPAQPTMTDQQRIDSARAEYRAAQTRLSSEHNDARSSATESAAIGISAAEARIEEIGRDLDTTLKELERETSTGTRELEDRIAALKLQQKDVRKAMMPLRQASAAGGTDARAGVELDPETAAKKARFAELSQMQASLGEQIAKATEDLEAFTENQARLRSDLMERAEADMGDLQDEIRATRSGLEATLSQLDDDYAADIAHEKQRISDRFGVRFR